MEALGVVAERNDKSEGGSKSDLKSRTILYLVECFERVFNEELHNPKVSA